MTRIAPDGWTGTRQEATELLLLLCDNSRMETPDSLEDIRVLVGAGADLESKKRAGFTPLYWAASRGYAQFCELLLELGANPDAANSAGETALHEAASRAECLEVCAVLIQRGANIHAVMMDNLRTPLDMAAARKLEDNCRLLLCMGAKPSKPVRIQTALSTLEPLPAHAQEFLKKLTRKMRKEVWTHFTTFPPVREECFTRSEGGHTVLDPHMLTACATGEFQNRIATPLIQAGNAEALDLFQDICAHLQPCWQREYQQLLLNAERARGDLGDAVLRKNAKAEGELDRRRRRGRGEREI